MAQSLAERLVDMLGGVPPWVVVLIISMIPILELRGGLIAAALLHMPLSVALPVCIIGNLIPIPFILLLLTKIFSWLKKTKRFRPLVERLEAKAEKNKDKVMKYEFWGLMLFVGIPLPMTGAWTGSLVAAVMDIRPKRRALLAEFLGLLMASAIMCIITYLIPWLIGGAR